MRSIIGCPRERSNGMMVEASELAQTIRTTRPMLPAKDFAISKQF